MSTSSRFAVAVHILIVAVHASTIPQCDPHSLSTSSFLLTVYGPSLLLAIYLNNECSKYIDGAVQLARASLEDTLLVEETPSGSQETGRGAAGGVEDAAQAPATAA